VTTQSDLSARIVGPDIDLRRTVAENWLKALGGGARGKRIPDDWSSLEDGLFDKCVTFGREPSVKRGDRIALYAAGWGLVFAVGEVTSYPYPRESLAGSNWPWCVDVHLNHSTRFIHDGVPLDDLSVDSRNLRVSMRRRSHIRLSDAEYGAAVGALTQR
jgi:hypothetical protein